MGFYPTKKGKSARKSLVKMEFKGLPKVVA
jgi:hypothetical protein